eukprot:CAMPEP_0183303626 /NCGR_PEP_ID=MMETSP0160_2-20130417/8987_1 /TAXON_ID=2839 ORGANISM="Odontella Sinensis, Strain Grunow 1884" /NCGR_SAMPLE_ID=MMETSP0160_2 /ASSEMBLY_ACC=CAM_ASM_000250 /LENGTH=1011 /DNA_ID=CAMNT_0025466551 /DNA_START=56 /DNA_END=3091 /DNA_ORIENTATION=+
MRLAAGSILLVAVATASASSAFAFSPASLSSRAAGPPAAATRTSSSSSSSSSLRSSSDRPFFASEISDTLDRPPTEGTSSSAPVNGGAATVASRPLGSQELLMLPRQYGPGDATFPPMSHVSAAVLSSTPDVETLGPALEEAMRVHPLLRSVVRGTGEPEERIDAFNMVRRGDADPPTFVERPVGSFAWRDVLDVVDAGDDLEGSWTDAFRSRLDDGIVSTGNNVLWKAELHKSRDGGRCALLLRFNHAISDQSSANLLLDQILSTLASIEDGGSPERYEPNGMPEPIENCVLGEEGRSKGVGPDVLNGFSPQTALYVAGKAGEDARGPVTLPDQYAKKQGNPILNALTTISGRAAGGAKDQQEQAGAAGCAGRSSVVQFRTLSEGATAKLLGRCREEGVTISNALSAAAALAATDFIGEGGERTYKVLQSLDMRRYELANKDTCDTVGCHAGSMDLMHGPLPDKLGDAVRSNRKSKSTFWDLAREGRDQTASFTKDNSGPEEAVRVFDFAMRVSDMNNLVHLTAMSKSGEGRAYSAGVTNAGVYERQAAARKAGEEGRGTLKSQHGRYTIESLHFATSHARTGCLYQASCLTVDGKLSMTFHPAAPLVPAETNAAFADAFVDLLEAVAEPVTAEEENSLPSIPKGSLTAVAAIGVVVANLIHAPAWADFLSNVATMKENVPPEDFWPALNFWIFFAVGHPILQPILWISDVLHGTPGPMVADLVPALFLAGNAAVIYAFAASKELQRAANVAALGAFLAYVGAGLDGTAGLGDYNLALNDQYEGRVVKGCPAYEDVRQPSMDNFDLEKYQGKWYEQKFHDWTQFKEVYDTTLDIRLTPDGKGWTDDFAVKGPAPKSAVLSWDKSPVANGAHYFLFGRVDDKDPTGVLRESGFGVEFPNYIVDVKKDAKTGEYTEAIQFQCLERGGVRVFEGINFMSRAPVMTEAEMAEMHGRAEKAGMYPYGANPGQMHQVERRDAALGEVDNSWQRMWRAIGFDKLLELLTESIEDGGR